MGTDDADETAAQGQRRRVVEHIERELSEARSAADPWPHLERAHILSQPWAWPHTKVHAVMLRQALRDRDGREAIGQVIRIVVAGPGSIVGRYPVGNTGRTTMALTEVAEVPADLDAILTTRDADRRVEPMPSPTVTCRSAARRNDHRVLT